MEQSHSGLASYLIILPYIYMLPMKSTEEFYMKSLDQVCGSLLMKEKLSFTLLKDTILLLGQ